MRYIIYGAGGIGASIGALLQLSGASVLFIARGEHGRRLQAQGLRFVQPSGITQLSVEVVLHPQDIRFTAQDVVLLCVKSQHSAVALDDLYAAATRSGFAAAELPLVCAQNGVSNEALALRRFRYVYAMLVQLPATYLTPGEVVLTAADPAGVLDTGCFPAGIDALTERLCADLRSAGFSATPDPRVMRKKYGKLLSNLFNAVQILLPLEQGWSESTQALLGQLKREALACYAAAGIDCTSQAEDRAISGQLKMQTLPGYERQGGSTWQSLMRGTGDIEVDYLNGEIVRLGRLHGVPTPVNEACQRLAVELVLRGEPAGSTSVAAIQTLVAQLDQRSDAG